MTANPRKNCFFDIIFFPLNFQLKRLSFTYRILIRRTPSELSLNPKGNTHTRSHMICLIVVVFSGLMFERSYQLWNKHGGLRLSAQKSGLRGWVRAGFELGSSFRQYHVLFYGKTQFNDVSLYHRLQISCDQLSDELLGCSLWCYIYYFLIDEISFAEIVGWI